MKCDYIVDCWTEIDIELYLVLQWMCHDITRVLSIVSIELTEILIDVVAIQLNHHLLQVLAVIVAFIQTIVHPNDHRRTLFSNGTTNTRMEFFFVFLVFFVPFVTQQRVEMQETECRKDHNRLWCITC